MAERFASLLGRINRDLQSFPHIALPDHVAHGLRAQIAIVILGRLGDAFHYSLSRHLRFQLLRDQQQAMRRIIADTEAGRNVAKCLGAKARSAATFLGPLGREFSSASLSALA
jgi:hypothetical protein